MRLHLLMMLLVTKAETTLREYEHPNLGRLVQPRHYDTNLGGRPWAADNDCFQGLDASAYRRMVVTLPTGAKFVTVPDVVGDHDATLRRWARWATFIRRTGHSAAFVAQDGCDDIAKVPADADALFIGGSTEFKLAAGPLIGQAKARGMWVHVGRVNSLRRIQWAQSVGADSVDGSGYAKFTDAMLPQALAFLGTGASQMSLTTTDRTH